MDTSEKQKIESAYADAQAQLNTARQDLQAARDSVETLSAAIGKAQSLAETSQLTDVCDAAQKKAAAAAAWVATCERVANEKQHDVAHALFLVESQAVIDEGEQLRAQWDEIKAQLQAAEARMTELAKMAAGVMNVTARIQPRADKLGELGFGKVEFFRLDPGYLIEYRNPVLHDWVLSPKIVSVLGQIIIGNV